MIQRYGFDTKGGYTLMGDWKHFPCMSESCDGEYVTYDDHQAAIAARDAVIREYLKQHLDGEYTHATCCKNDCPTCAKALALVGGEKGEGTT